VSVLAGADTNPGGEVCPQGAQIIFLSRELFRVDRTLWSSLGEISVELDFDV